MVFSPYFATGFEAWWYSLMLQNCFVWPLFETVQDANMVQLNCGFCIVGFDTLLLIRDTLQVLILTGLAMRIFLSNYDLDLMQNAVQAMNVLQGWFLLNAAETTGNSSMLLDVVLVCCHGGNIDGRATGVCCWWVTEVHCIAAGYFPFVSRHSKAHLVRLGKYYHSWRNTRR